MRPPARAYIAIGANLGDREKTIRTALDRLASDDVRIMRVSDLFDFPAVGGPPDSPRFLNGAAKLSTTLDPQQLLDRMLDVERSLGRERNVKWSPRTIDLDLLLYGEELIDTPTLKVPHPLMHDRDFVLEPLAQIAPDVVHPKLGWTIAELLKFAQE